MLIYAHFFRKLLIWQSYINNWNLNTPVQAFHYNDTAKDFDRGFHKQVNRRGIQWDHEKTSLNHPIKKCFALFERYKTQRYKKKNELKALLR